MSNEKRDSSVGTKHTQGSNSNRGSLFLAFSILLFGLILLGFGPTFFARPLYQERPLNWILVVHGIASTGWFVILILQSFMIRFGLVLKHIKIGQFGWVLIAMIFVLGIPAAIGALPRQVADGQLEPSVLGTSKHYAQVARDVLLFGLFAGLGIVGLVLRKKPQPHKRLMLLASIVLTTPGLARLSQFEILRGIPEPLGFLGILALLFALLMIRDKLSEGRIHPVLKWGSPTTFATIFLLLLVPELL